MILRNKIIKMFEAHDLFDIQGSPRDTNMWHSYPSTDYAILEDKKYPRIYCDMDGVLVDFHGGFFAKTQQLPNEYEAIHGKDAFWDLVESWGEEFWANLPWMQDGKELWTFISKYNPIILSAAMATYQRNGKAMWLSREIGYNDPYVKRPEQWKGNTNIIFHKDKYKFILEQGEILIDDTQKKIIDWESHGGQGILHVSASQTINTLTEIIDN